MPLKIPKGSFYLIEQHVLLKPLFSCLRAVKFAEAPAFDVHRHERPCGTRVIRLCVGLRAAGGGLFPCRAMAVVALAHDRPWHPYNAKAELVKVSPTRQTQPALSTMRRNVVGDSHGYAAPYKEPRGG